MRRHRRSSLVFVPGKFFFYRSSRVFSLYLEWTQVMRGVFQ